jgi:uncharacterized phiE125 gp8 family phage protein
VKAKQPARLVAPAALLTLADARNWLRIEGTDHDQSIQQALDAAVQYLDGWSGITGRCLVTQTWLSYAVQFPGTDGFLDLPLAPCASITAVRWRNAAGALTTLSAAAYALVATNTGPALWFDPQAGLAAPLPSPAVRPDGVEIEAIYGQSAAEVPAPLKQAVLQLTAHWFENRGAAAFGGGFGLLPIGVRSLIAPFRRVPF